MYTCIVKVVIYYYILNELNVFACALNAYNAFDCVAHEKLFQPNVTYLKSYIERKLWVENGAFV